MSEPLGSPTSVLEPEADEFTDAPWVVIVWNDPVNLMDYVTLVLQQVFGYPKEKATRLMLEIHHDGRSVVSHGTRAEAERDMFRLHDHGLWATMEHQS